MSDVTTRIEGRAGRITLTRAKALNALSHDMCLTIERALDDWAENDMVAVIVIDAEGERAFSAGGDLAEMYHAAKAGKHDGPRAFWRDEYRMNLKLSQHPKPIVSLMHGFVLGGGVGLGAHVSHRVVGESTQVGMPECNIGLIPDVGGTRLLALAPGRLGEYLALTNTRMGPGDAIRAGFADHFVPEADWPALIARLAENGDVSAVIAAAQPAPAATLAAEQEAIDRLFAGGLSAITAALDTEGSPLAEAALKVMRRNSALSMAATLELIARARKTPALAAALEQEYRFTYRSFTEGEFGEGIRAQVIDKDRSPSWSYTMATVPPEKVDAMLAPLGAVSWSE